MAFTHQKTVTVTPQNDVYGWAVVDNATNQAANWVTVTQQGSTDVWDFLCLLYTSPSPRDQA